MLNPSQLKAAQHTLGPLLLLAGAGSGKTLSITERYKNIIKSGVSESNVLMITFTNKAANEMKHRIMKDPAYRCPNVSTFHSLAVRILRKYAGELEFSSKFSIFDDHEQKKLIKQLMKDTPALKPSIKADKIKTIIGNNKNNGVFSARDYVIDEADQNQIREICIAYNNRLKQANAFDFDDLLLFMLRLLETRPTVLRTLQNKFQYIIIDEYQDTNQVQYKTALRLSEGHHNLCVTGDISQCLEENTLIDTDLGKKRIIDVEIGDTVKTLKRGNPVFSKVTNKSVSISEEFIEIATLSGKVLKLSPTHLCFASLPEFNALTYYLYIMYRKDLGYRIGISRGGKRENIRFRSSTEKATRVWLLMQFSNANEAHYHELRLAMEYKIPTLPFHLHGRNLKFSEEDHKNIFNAYGLNGLTLIKDLGMSFDYPTYYSQNSTGPQSSRNIHIILNNTRTGTYVSCESEGDRVRAQFHTAKDAYVYAKKVLAEKGSEYSIVEKFSMESRETYPVMRACQLMPTMNVPVIDEKGKLAKDIITSIKRVKSSVKVVDLEIAETGILIGNDIATHNSIYSFRAADYRIILSFLKDFPNATRIDLNENYRSTTEIVDCANTLIKNNTQRFDNESLSMRGSNKQPVSYENYSSSFEEAQMISLIISQETKEGKKFKDFTVLCRTNAQSMPLENMFMTNRIPYTMVSGFSFFDRKEVKDMLSYLKFLYNTDDFNAYLRICNVPKRGLGETTSVRFTTTCANNNLKFFNYVIDNPDLKDYRSIGLTKTAFEKNLEFFNKLRLIDASLPVGDIMDHVMEHLGFEDMLKEQEAFILEKDGLVKDKMLFIEQLKEMSVNIAKELGRNTLEGFLSYTSLFSDKDNVDEDDKVKIMTIHASKGLEFKNVFIPGVNENILPHSRSQHPEGIEEERRLFYVAITRAQDQVYISSTDTMNVFGKETESKPSRFIQELNIE